MLLPVAGGLWMLWKPAATEKSRRIWCECVVCLTSLCVWGALAAGRTEPFTVYYFSRGFSVRFQLDGLGHVALRDPVCL